MPNCIISGCANRSSLKRKRDEQRELESYRNISYHKFPQDPQKRQLWLNALNLNTWNPPKTAAICSAHFTQNDYQSWCTTKRILKPTAVPSINIDMHNITAVSTTAQSGSAIVPADEAFIVDEKNTTTTSTTTQSGSAIVPADEAFIVDEKNTTTTSTTTQSGSAIVPADEAFMIDASTSVSPERLFHSPGKKRLREAHARQMKLVRRQLYHSKQQTFRYQKRIESLKGILQSLKKKNLLPCEELDIIENFSEWNKNLLTLQIRKIKKLKVPRLYAPELRRFAITLHYYSPRAYNYVRKKLNNCLPHAQTLSKWYTSVRGEPGINTESLEMIRHRVQNSSHPLIGTLMFDEMAIRQHLDYSCGTILGYVAMGDNIESDDVQLAKEVLVFCVVCLTEKWKVPVAYYLINGINAEKKANLILQCLTALHEVGFRIVSLTCDGMSTNVTTLKLLGCNFLIDNFKTYFQHPISKNKIFVFLDASHMIKLIRNTLGSTKKLRDSNGQEIKWQYLEKLHELQSAEGFHLGNKLTIRHIDYAKQIMKVKLATQLLSKSVADALTFCKDYLKLPDFQDSSATIRFLQIFNDLFDIFNSLSLKQHGCSKPLNDNNFTEIKEKLEKTSKYINGLQIPLSPNKFIKLLDSKKRIGFLGFLIDIQSLLQLFEELCVKENILKYIPTYKMSQDHLETIFSIIRSRSGYNNNPTVKQFKSAFKKIICHTELTAPPTANCTSSPDIKILSISSARNPADIINTTCTSSYRWTNLLHTEDHDYVHNMYYPTEFGINVIVYIAGFVVRKIQKTVDCLECLKVLITTCQETTYHALIQSKTRGYLIVPSSDVIFICKCAEKIIRTQFKHCASFSKSKNAYTAVENTIIQEFVGTNIFHELNEHIQYQNFSENHRTLLIRLIVKIYAKTRICHFLKEINIKTTERQYYNKLVLFKGQ